MKVIDFRVRPPYKSFSNNWFFGEQVLTQYQLQSGQSIGESAKQRSMELYMQEMNEAEICHAVITGRNSFGNGYKNIKGVVNDDIVELIDLYPDCFSGVIGIDSTDTSTALQQIDKYIKKGNCCGITVECGFSKVPIRFDDKSLYPIYQKCEQVGAFVVLTAGNAYSKLKESDPVAFDNIAVDFPNVRFVLSHVGWPWIIQTIWVALKRDNVWLMPDFYMFDAPGKDDFVYAINTTVRDKVMFGSCYPLISFQNAIACNLSSGIKEEALEDYLYNNAARFLGIK